jgi:hypothetical protein
LPDEMQQSAGCSHTFSGSPLVEKQHDYSGWYPSMMVSSASSAAMRRFCSAFAWRVAFEFISREMVNQRWH